MPTITTSLEDGILIMRIDSRELNEDVAREMVDKTLAAAAYQPNAPVLLDFSAVSFMPSLGIGALVTLQKKLKDDKHRLIVSSVQAPVRAMLALCRLDMHFQFADSEREARSRLLTE